MAGKPIEIVNPHGPESDEPSVEDIVIQAVLDKTIIERVSQAGRFWQGGREPSRISVTAIHQDLLTDPPMLPKHDPSVEPGPVPRDKISLSLVTGILHSQISRGQWRLPKKADPPQT